MGIYTDTSLDVPGNIFDWSKVNLMISPFGTPGCSTLAESTGYFSLVGCAGACTYASMHMKAIIFFMLNNDLIGEQPARQYRLMLKIASLREIINNAMHRSSLSFWLCFGK